MYLKINLTRKIQGVISHLTKKIQLKKSSYYVAF